MRTYLIFLFCEFDDFDDVEFFCTDVFGQTKEISSIKYVLQNLNNLIIIFETDVEKYKLEEILTDLLNLDTIHYYFIFDKQHIFMLYLPEKMQEYIFKPNHLLSKLLDEPKQESKLDLNEILDKINKNGINSLTNEEKKYLDNFEN